MNLKTKNVCIAHQLAGKVRESGCLIQDEAGKKVRVPGILKYVKAIGIELKGYNISQVSMNLTNYEKTPIYRAFETVKELAKEYGTEVTGSEIVGLVPKKALIDAGVYYTDSHSEGALIQAAVENLGLNQLNTFEPKKKIIEYLL